jgi:hypothetical protein
MLQKMIVDSKGLAKIARRRGTNFAVAELVQNAWDEPGVTAVRIDIKYLGYRKTRLIVEDDAPGGFKDLRHAFTLFAESGKKANPEQRGRFNFGEKLILACCDQAQIVSTTGAYRFDAHRRYPIRARTTVGSRIECILPMIEDECTSLEAYARSLICPEHIETSINGHRLPTRLPEAQINVALPTEIADENGVLRPSTRSTPVRLYPVHDGEAAMLYELGIPVVETRDKRHYDVGQKAPLSLERDNVQPAFLRRLRVAVMNHMHRQLSTGDVTTEWAQAAMDSPDCHPDAVRNQ